MFDRRPRTWLSVENLEERVTPTRMIAYGTDAGVTAAVFVRTDADGNGSFESVAPQPGGPGSVQFNPFGTFAGGVRVATGDIDGDGNDELITAAGPGGTPLVMIWDLGADGSVGALIDSFYAYDTGFNGGVYVAAGDIDGDGRAEVITGAGAGGGPHVKIYSDTNGDGRVSDNVTDSFFAYVAGFTGGVRVAAGDINSDGRAEVITGAGPGGGPHVQVFTDTNQNGKVSDDAVLSSFFAYTAGFTGGVYVAAGRGGDPFIITGAGEGGGPHVRIFNPSGTEFDSLYPVYGSTFTGGVRVAAGDAAYSPTSPLEVITVAGPGGSAHTRVFDDNNDAGTLLSDNAPKDDFVALNTNSGYFIAFGNVVSESFSGKNTPVNLPDLTTVNQTLSVPSSAGRIADLNVSLSLTHTSDSDLVISLTHVPSGTTRNLIINTGGSADGFHVLLDDSASTSIAVAAPTGTGGPIAGQFTSQNSVLGAFNGLDASGLWRLTIADTVGGDSGVLLSWALHFTYVN